MEVGLWIPLNDYCRIKNISISTIRRYVKAGKVQYRMESGKYLIYTPWAGEEGPDPLTCEVVNLKKENEEFQNQIRQLRQENADLRMLVQIYEKNNNKAAVIEDIPIFPPPFRGENKTGLPEHSQV
ncbi:MAG: hypothetical protein WCG27_07410 [Pseudomonadota bacterium]